MKADASYKRTKSPKDQSKRDKARHLDKQYQAKTWKLIGEAMSKKYDVYAVSKTRNGERGRTYVTAALTGGLGTALITSARVKKYSDYNGDYPWAIKSTKFLVR